MSSLYIMVPATVHLLLLDLKCSLRLVVLIGTEKNRTEIGWHRSALFYLVRHPNLNILITLTWTSYLYFVSGFAASHRSVCLHLDHLQFIEAIALHLLMPPSEADDLSHALQCAWWGVFSLPSVPAFLQSAPLFTLCRVLHLSQPG